jgi:hypothetical protein
LIREEKMGQQQNYDTTIMTQISQDAQFQDNLEYLDEKADQLSHKKEKKAFDKAKNVAINDFKRSQEAIERCAYCYKDKGPRISVISEGTRCYLAFPETIDLVQGHCQIVPFEHYLTLLDCDDDEWAEIRASFLFFVFNFF